MSKQTMLITSCTWNEEKYNSFKLIPLDYEAPYVEIFFDPELKILVLLAKDKKEHFAMLPKIDEFGRKRQAKERGQLIDMVERQRVSTYKEHYVSDLSEMEQIINALAFNAETYDYKQYFGDLIPHSIIEKEETTEVDTKISNLS